MTLPIATVTAFVVIIAVNTAPCLVLGFLQCDLFRLLLHLLLVSAAAAIAVGAIAVSPAAESLLLL